MNIFILTGAGISAESGLKPFRDNGALWEGKRLEEICTPDALAKNPEVVCAFYDDLRRAAMQAKPNPAHLALSKLEEFWRDGGLGEFLIVTQNLDDLHERAGSRNVLHMHGSLFDASCMECGQHGSRYSQLEDARECLACGRDALRPDVVLFGEAPRHMRQIDVSLNACDLFWAVGTSDTVHPASGFVKIAKARGAETHHFNIGLPPANSHFDRCHVGNAGEHVPQWVSELID